MKPHGAGKTDVGRKRTNNEDAFWIDDDLGAYVVCDGMGGHAGGEKAASVAIASVRQSLSEAADTIHEVRAGGAAGHARLVNIVEGAVLAACKDVHDVACSSEEYRGMGCTMTLLLVAGSKAALGHVGDTRLYMQRDGGVDQLTSDHTMAADFVRKAKMTPEAARNHRYSSALTRALGPQSSVDVETLIFEVLPDDVFLICSDGLSAYVESLGELTPFLTRGDVDEMCGELIDLANERGGHDNVTAVVVKMFAQEEEYAEPSALGSRIRQDLSCLRATEIFEDIPFAHLLRMYSFAEVRECRASEQVLKAGEGLEGMYCVLSGAFHIQAPQGEARRIEAGVLFGAPALLVRTVTPVSVKAVEAGRLLFLDAESFRRLTAQHPRVGVTLVSRIAQDVLTEQGKIGSRSVLVQPRRRKAWWNPLVWARA